MNLDNLTKVRNDALEEAARVVETIPKSQQVRGSYFDTAEGHSFPETRATTFFDAAKAIRALLSRAEVEPGDEGKGS